MAVTDETEAKVRRHRDWAEEYGRRVLAGEKPWEDMQDTEPLDAGFDETVPEPTDGDVGESGTPGGEVDERPPTYMEDGEQEPAP